MHRQLTALGVKNILITPRDLDRDHTGVKNDARDAREMAQDLDRYVRGNTKALRVAYVPTVLSNAASKATAALQLWRTG